MSSPEHQNWTDIKPRFYADARTYYRDSVLPDLVKRPLVLSLGNIDPMQPFVAVEVAMKGEMSRTYYETADEAPSCPYHEDLAHRLRTRPILLGREILDISNISQKVFLESTFPGAFEAPVTVCNLLASFGRIKEVFGLDVDTGDLAGNSANLIDKPLRHPVQWAVPFIFCLVPPEGVIQFGRIVSFDREIGFFNDEMIRNYLTVLETETGPRIDWRIPFEELVINAQVSVYDRMNSTEYDERTAIDYPVGTRLGDIVVTERIISCPGKEIAHWLWQAGVATAKHNNLWEIKTTS